MLNPTPCLYTSLAPDRLNLPKRKNPTQNARVLPTPSLYSTGRFENIKSQTMLTLRRDLTIYLSGARRNSIIHSNFMIVPSRCEQERFNRVPGDTITGSRVPLDGLNQSTMFTVPDVNTGILRTISMLCRPPNAGEGTVPSLPLITKFCSGPPKQDRIINFSCL
jgi:hypothetical protein